MSDTNAVPNPGSNDAIARGCICPVLDNHHGAGMGWGANTFWIREDCPLHCPTPETYAPSSGEGSAE